MSKVEAIDYGDRQVFTVSAFNRGVGSWLQRLPTVWVEGEISELRRQERWQSVFFTLKDTTDGSILAGLMPRGQFDALRLDLQNGERVHVYGRPELFEPRGELRLRALGIERFGLGEHLAALERLKQKLAAEGLFAPERKRPLPRIPRRIGLVTGNDAAAKRDVIASVQARFPPARIVVAETFVQGPRAARAVVDALQLICTEPEVDVVVLARGGGSFEDLLPFSDERVVRAVAGCPVPVVSAVGHEQDTPLCDLAADVRASTPTAAARLVVPDLEELLASLERARSGLGRGARRSVERHRERLTASATRLERAAGLLVERRRSALDRSAARLRALSPLATLERGYAIVRREGAVVRSATGLAPGDEVDVKLAEGGFTGTVGEIRS
ncbi:MAG TPA: exodeoxyribonuclease VII large subunit [Gaiellaceae bacterium]|nr:exodeoxyribonuclease VII large subunit [Gaiellaceae bacterium]